ncbi:accessory gene regulator B [Clostridium acidisoli DSM 12555]|uniref:Accessory gene regulator B n=1 Tax=Clostridium acidisoli DSM 12555 TaxID=1121291 RepID=A0A1W1XL35_9CLOT|nr:accessory gene regulator B [Clostridium acidisoli DSM 12555]
MFLLERLSIKIGHTVAIRLNLDNNHEEILTYGAFGLLQTFFSIFLIMTFGFLFHVFFESLVISFSISILRKYSGGVHSCSPNRCALIGTFVCVSFSLFTIFILKTLPLTIIFLLIIISFIYSYYYIHKHAPVDSSAKPINNILKRQKLKQSSLIIVCILYGIISILLLLYINSSNINFLIYAFCISIGTTWQTFTLTYLGHKFIHKIDSISIKL